MTDQRRNARPTGDPIGRQPHPVIITPSKPQPWYGSIVSGEIRAGAVVGGETLTREQCASMASLKLGPEPPTLTVKRQATDREMWWPLGSLPPILAFECPIIGDRKDGRVKVLAPSGVGKRVDADGWAHRPYRTPRAVFG